MELGDLPFVPTPRAAVFVRHAARPVQYDPRVRPIASGLVSSRTNSLSCLRGAGQALPIGKGRQPVMIALKGKNSDAMMCIRSHTLWLLCWPLFSPVAAARSVAVEGLRDASGYFLIWSLYLIEGLLGYMQLLVREQEHELFPTQAGGFGFCQERHGKRVVDALPLRQAPTTKTAGLRHLRLGFSSNSARRIPTVLSTGFSASVLEENNDQ